MPSDEIRMLDNTFDSQKKRLGKCEIKRVPADVSSEDAEILVDAGKAEPLAAVADLKKDQIVNELRDRRIDFDPELNKPELADLLTGARESAAIGA